MTDPYRAISNRTTYSKAMHASVDLALQQALPAGVTLPKRYVELLGEPNLSAQYLLSCANGERFLYVSPSFSQLTGYSPDTLCRQSARFLVENIYPADLATITQILLEAHHRLASATPQELLDHPLQLTYRLKKADGTWLWLEETKWIIGFTDTGIKDLILGFMQDISQQKTEQEQTIQQLLTQQRNSHSLLQEVLNQQKRVEYFSLPDLLDPVTQEPISLTKREREVLQHLAAGGSTRTIADQLFISENTVETHRKHLLQKFGVKNSVELVRCLGKVL